MNGTEAGAAAVPPPEILAEDGGYQVCRCASGCLHVRMGQVTVHMSAREYRRLVLTLVEASIVIDVRDAVASPKWRQ